MVFGPWRFSFTPPHPTMNPFLSFLSSVTHRSALLGLVLVSLSPLGAADVPPVIQKIIDENGAIEDAVAVAREISYQKEEGDRFFEITGWFNQNHRLIKLSEGIGDSHGTQEREFSFREDGALIFIWERSEMMPNEENAPTHVTEHRFYFSDEKLEQVLFKEATIPAGEEQDLDISDVENEVLDEEEMMAALGDIDVIQDTVDEYKAGFKALEKPKFTRTIQDTESPDGRYALAWAPDSGNKEDVTEDGELAEVGSVHNYLVQLKPRKVLALTNGSHFADSSEIARLTSRAIWSENSQWVLEINENKWGVTTAALFCIQDGEFVTNPVDVLKELDAAVLLQMEEDKHDAAEKMAAGDPFVPSFEDITIDNEGVLSFGVSAMIPHDKDGDASSGYTGQVTLTPGFEDSGFMIANKIEVSLVDETR
jgi:hypothetical protein